MQFLQPGTAFSLLLLHSSSKSLTYSKSYPSDLGFKLFVQRAFLSCFSNFPYLPTPKSRGCCCCPAQFPSLVGCAPLSCCAYSLLKWSCIWEVTPDQARVSGQRLYPSLAAWPQSGPTFQGIGLSWSPAETPALHSFLLLFCPAPSPPLDTLPIIHFYQGHLRPHF